MSDLPLQARLYLIGCYVIAGLALGWCFLSFQGRVTLPDVVLGAGLAALAAACQIFTVARKSTTGQRSDHLTLAPLFAAVVLAPRPILALIIVATFLPEWYIHRRSWFGQLFNISAYLIAAVAGRLTLYQITGEYRLTAADSLLSLNPLGFVMAIPVFEGTQAVLLAWVLKLARGQSFRQSGLFAPPSLLLEIGLICLGLGFATAYVLNPVYGIIAAIPLLLIFDALHVPNLKEEAATDPKTGLANMRHFDAAMAHALDRAERSSQPLSLLVCDLDYLRNINNTYGHQAGDTVLVGIADILRRNLREHDVAARFGGEEFVVVLPDIAADDAGAVAERLRLELQAIRFDVGHADGPIGATISIGVAAYPGDGQTHQDLMREADLAVYAAKRDGRNRVVVAGRGSRELAGDWARENLAPAPVGTLLPQPKVKRPRWHIVDQLTRASLNNQSDGADAHRRASATAAPPAATGAPRRSSGPSPLLLWFIGLVVAAAAATLRLGWHGSAVPWEGLLLFAGLTAAAELVSLDNAGRTRISVSIVPILAGGLLYHQPGIVITAVAAACATGFRARSPLHRVLFNLATILLSAQGAHWVFTTLGGHELSALPIADLLIPATLAGLSYYVINQALLCIVRGLHERRSPLEVWSSEYRWLWPNYLALGALGLLVARGFLDYGLAGVVALLSPVAMMHITFREFMRRSKTHVDELQHMNGRLTDSYEATLQALTHALDTRDEETEEHSQRVRQYTEMIGRRLGVAEDELTEIARGALLHDIGKIGVPDAILLKPGRLTPDEVTIMRKHPEIGFRMIAHIPFLVKAGEVVLYHHEAYDGSGYPSGLAGDQIPLGARLFAVADTYDAMTSDRPYRSALTHHAALAEIERCRGTQFDPRVVDAFLAIAKTELAAVRENAATPATSGLQLTGPDLSLAI